MEKVYVVHLHSGTEIRSLTMYANKELAHNHARETITNQMVYKWGMDDPDNSVCYSLYSDVMNAFIRGNYYNGLGLYNSLVFEKPDWKEAFLFVQVEEYEVIGSKVEEKEILCGHCKRKNDTGVSTCWFCGNKP